MKNPYSKQEIEFIEAHFHEMTHEELGSAIGRSKSSVASFLSEKGLIKIKKNNHIEIEGKYGCLTVLRETEKRTSQGSKIWECVCDCNLSTFASTDLLNRNPKCKCGIPKTVKLSENPHLNQRFRKYKSSAKKRGYSFDINIQKFDELIQQNCHYCNHPGPNGIDRIDSSLGYSNLNCLPCCKICNRAKSNMDYQEFLKYLDFLIGHRKAIL